jgi:signal transduction histidine kinase
MAVGFGLSAGLYTRLGLFDEPAELWVTVLAGVLCTLPLALRRRMPIVTLAIVLVGFFIAGQFLVPEVLITQISLFMAMYTVGAWEQNRLRANIARAVVVVFMAVWVFVSIAITVNDTEALPYLSRSGLFSALAAWAVIQIVTNLFYFAGAWYFGNAMWARAAQTAQLKSKQEELAAEHEFSAQQAVALDRVRIARELHDVVAHHVSVMGVQAGAARRVLASDSAQASTSLELIEQSARTAVDELHKLLVTLRESADAPASDSASTRGIAQLPELVDSTVAAGTPAELQVIGDARPVTPLVGFTLYRVAQEALTNVRKHAGRGARADVRLRYLPDAVELEVVDSGSLGSRPTGPSGLGQRGMRERVAAVGGTIELGRRSVGGYLVRASIPTAS